MKTKTLHSNTGWTDVLQNVDEPSLTEQFFCVFDDSPVALACYMLYRAGEYDQLVSKDLNPLDYNNLEDFRAAYACINFLRKSETLKTSHDRKEIAYTKFRASEEHCRRINMKFQDLTFAPDFIGTNTWLLEGTRRKIAEILGFPCYTDRSHRVKSVVHDVIGELLSSAGWGPGASTCITGRDTSSSTKFKQERHISFRLYQVMSQLNWAESYPLWGAILFPERLMIQDFGKVTSVPKNAKTDRTICVEPGFNIWFQKGAGRWIRKRLRMHGVNLNDSRRNEKLARRGSLGEPITCVDFEAASDTISREVVRELLPPEVFTLLDCLRSVKYKVPGARRPVLFEKFSSMGNGFTFELESLIFYASALACCELLDVEGPVSVYGDDVVLPTEAFPLYAEFTKFLGFKVNRDKTASSGYFRESCGSYWWNGVSVKPFYNKKGLSSAKHIIHAANSVRAMAHSANCGLGCDARFQSYWKLLVSSLPSKFKRLKGTVSSGAGCLHLNFDEAWPSVARLSKPKNGEPRRTWWGGYLHPVMIEKARTYQTDSEGLLLTHLWTLSQRETNAEHEERVDPGCQATDMVKLIGRITGADLPLDTRNTVSLRNSTKAKAINAYVLHWYDFGPWI